MVQWSGLRWWDEQRGDQLAADLVAWWEYLKVYQWADQTAAWTAPLMAERQAGLKADRWAA